MKSVSNEDDEIAWQEVVAEVKPLPESHIVSIKKPQPIFKGEKTETLPPKIFKHKLSLGTTSDIDGNTLRRFKRGDFPIEGVLDLHGYTEDKAYDAVHKFMIKAYMSGKRCVIIVTGKGLPHPEQDDFAPKGVLKDRVPQWLESDELSQIILTYIHPSVKLGGEGALCILLRRQRDK